METVNCALCDGAEWTRVVEAEDPDAAPPRPKFTVVRCRACGLHFTNPRPAPEEIGKFYAADYTPHQLARRSNSWEKFKNRWHARFPIFGRNYERGDCPPIGQKRLLDFGCGGGAFLLRMQERGWNVAGLDFSEATVNRLRTELDLNVFHGTLPHPDLASGSFDLITMWHSLEHVHQPLEVLRDAHRLLAPGGRILVAVPNVESLSFAWFDAYWQGLDVPRHLTHFSPATLQKMLEKADFRVLCKKHVRQSYWLRLSLKRIRRDGQLSWPQSWMQSKLVSSYVSQFQKCFGRADGFLMIAEKMSLR